MQTPLVSNAASSNLKFSGCDSDEGESRLQFRGLPAGIVLVERHEPVA